MLNLMDKFRRLTRTKTNKDLFVENFLREAEHNWVNGNKHTTETFTTLWKMLPSSLLEHLQRNPINFVRKQDYVQAAGARYHLKNTVIIFPEYEKLLAIGGGEAVAFLAHEVALILYETDVEMEQDPLMAEVEADKFVCDLGLADELERLLLSMDESSEKRLRLTYLTFKAFGIN